MHRSSKTFGLFFVLLAICLFGLPAQAERGEGSGTVAPAETATYVFLSDQSTVVQTGGIAGVHETYPIEGQFRLSVDFDAGTASFPRVDANLLYESPFLPTQSLGELFNMTELVGTIAGDTAIDFTGRIADGTNTNILLRLTFADDLVHLTGQTIPPPNSADFFHYNLDAVARKKYGGGTGEPNDHYLIYTAEQMNTIGAEPNDWDKHFKLMADIDLSAYMGTEFNTIGYYADWNDTKPFTGAFDGRGKKISNFNYTSTNKDCIGLFACVEGAEIRDLGLIDPNVDAGTGDYIGSLAGRLGKGTITNCYMQGGSVSGNDYVGGLVGENSWVATITDCYSSGKVSGFTDVGGLVGENHNTITNCYSNGDVLASGNAFRPGGAGGLVGKNYGTIINCTSSTSVSGNDYTGGLVARNYGIITNCYAASSVSGSGNDLWCSGVGGLVGYNYHGTITNCYSLSSVVGTKNVGGLVGENSWDGTISYCCSRGNVSGNDPVGGLVGTNNNTITNCYATGSVLASGTEWWPGIGGGLVGENSWGGTIFNCYSAGSVSCHTIAGGLLGFNYGTVTACFWDIETSGRSYMCGRQMWGTGCNNANGKTTAEMQMQSTFTNAGWDFVGESVNGTEDIWSICEETNYPRLAMQIPAGDFICPDGITIEDFVFFIEHWGDDNCDPSNDYCQGTDLDFSGIVDADDLEILLENWLQSQPILPPQPPLPPPPPGPPPPPPKGRACFVADTPVWANGALVQISNVVPGQMIRDYHCDPATDCLEQIETVEEHEGTFECRDIVLESGNRISVVDAHCFMLDSGQWVAAQDLRSGLRLKTLSGTVGIKSVAKRAAPLVGKVYNLKVTRVDRYLVSQDRVIVRDY